MSYHSPPVDQANLAAPPGVLGSGVLTSCWVLFPSPRSLWELHCGISALVVRVCIPSTQAEGIHFLLQPRGVYSNELKPEMWFKVEVQGL